MSKFQVLDSVIFTAVKNGISTFERLCHDPKVKMVARDWATPDRWGVKNYANLISRRLNALRKAGSIKFNGRGWEINA